MNRISAILSSQMFKDFVFFSFFGAISFFLNLSLLFISREFLHVHYLIGVPGAFLIASAFHFFFAKRFVFTKSTQSTERGLAIFLAIGLFDAILITAGVALQVEMLGINLYVARVVMGLISALVNFFLNARYNFKTV